MGEEVRGEARERRGGVVEAEVLHRWRPLNEGGGSEGGGGAGRRLVPRFPRRAPPSARSGPRERPPRLGHALPFTNADGPLQGSIGVRKASAIGALGTT